MHIADATQLMEALAGDDIKPSERDSKLAEKAKAAPPDKEAILTQLATNFAAVRKDMESARNGSGWIRRSAYNWGRRLPMPTRTASRSPGRRGT